MTLASPAQINTISVGEQLPSISIPVTLQRLVMEAGANRDLSLIHHDRDVARATGADDAYMNTFFIAGMFERLLRQWMGPQGQLRKISNLRMSRFNCVGDQVTFSGVVEAIDVDAGEVTVALASDIDTGTTVTATAVCRLDD
ncbi:MAG: hypothetical protein AB8B96_15730 [Lysobacterales bacterium]